MKYTRPRQSNSVAKERIDYKSYESRRHQEAKKSKVNPIVETILSIEDLLMEIEVNWSISYEPSTKSYSIFIANLSEEEPKPKQDLGDTEPKFDTEFIFDSGYDCHDFINYLKDMEECYGVVTVADVYKYVEQDLPEYSSAYGWLKDDVNKIYFEQLPFEGYLLKLSKPKPIY